MNWTSNQSSAISNQYRLRRAEENHHSSFGRKRSFTLIELLIILAVIVIQAQLLLPALNRAKGTVGAVSCTDNLKKIGTAHQSYISDYDGWLLPAQLNRYASAEFRGPQYFHAWQWFGMLSGYTARGARQVCRGYNLKYGGLSNGRKKSPDFACPAEPVDFGSYAKNLFEYTHYAINGFLVGTTNERTEIYKFNRKITCLTEPAQALIFADNRYLAGCSMCPSVNNLGFRHGAADPRPYTGNKIESAAGTTGKCNMIFMDNHVDAVDYKTFITWKPGRPLPKCYDKSYYHMFMRGFDAFK